MHFDQFNRSAHAAGPRVTGTWVFGASDALHATNQDPLAFAMDPEGPTLKGPVAPDAGSTENLLGKCFGVSFSVIAIYLLFFFFSLFSPLFSLLGPIGRPEASRDHFCIILLAVQDLRCFAMEYAPKRSRQPRVNPPQGPGDL